MVATSLSLHTGNTAHHKQTNRESDNSINQTHLNAYLFRMMTWNQADYDIADIRISLQLKYTQTITRPIASMVVVGANRV